MYYYDCTLVCVLAHQFVMPLTQNLEYTADRPIRYEYRVWWGDMA